MPGPEQHHRDLRVPAIASSALGDAIAIGTPQGPNPPMCPTVQPGVAFDGAGNLALTQTTTNDSDEVLVEMFEWDIVNQVQIGANAVTSGKVAVKNPLNGPWIVPITAPKKGAGIKTYYKIRATPTFKSVPNAAKPDPTNVIIWV